MIGKPFDAVGLADIQGLVEQSIPEDRTLEYKQELPARSDDAHREFLADVASFANTSGGDIVFGISERKDASGENTGIPDAAGVTFNGDREVLRLEGMVQAGLQPRIAGIRTKAIDGLPNGSVLLMRIPKSWAGPHMVVFRNGSRFFARSSKGKYQLDVGQLRAAFLATEGPGTRLREFRLERIARVLGGETPVGTRGDEPRLILHLVPLSSIDPQDRTDVSLVAREFPALSRPIDASSFNSRFNFDGFLLFGGNAGGQPGLARSYTQVFRQGAIEAVTELIAFVAEPGERRVRGDIEKTVIEATTRYRELLQRIGLEPPLAVALSLVGVRDYRLVMSDQRWPKDEVPNLIDRDALLLPDVLVEDFTTPMDISLKPTFDLLWQAAGRDGCKNYGPDGRWKQPRG